jgi:hypothetical protein
MITAAVIAVFAVLAGITISFYADLPAVATVVMVNFLLFVLSFPVKNLLDEINGSSGTIRRSTVGALVPYPLSYERGRSNPAGCAGGGTSERPRTGTTP